MAPMEVSHSKGNNILLRGCSDCSVSVAESHEDDHDKSIAKGGVTTPFPWKLHDMLDDMDRNGTLSVVCWQPHGRAFMVNKPKEFVENIMPHYFNQSKYASFQRQLNLYGFSRLSHGKDKGAYYHQCFVRGERNLCRGMVRQKIKGTKVRRTLSPEEEPNFYLPHWSKGLPAPLPSPPEDTVDSVPLQFSAETSSVPSKASLKPVEPTPEPTTSLVSLMSDKKQHTQVPALLPPPPFIKPLHQPSRAVLEESPAPSVEENQGVAKGGDLLFFEGLPFRYLEHIEELPPLPPQQTNYRETLHDMITSIVSMEAPWAENPNTCLV